MAEIRVFYHSLEKTLQSLLSSLEGTELWHNVSSVVPLFEKILGSLLNSMQAENGKNTTRQRGYYLTC